MARLNNKDWLPILVYSIVSIIILWHLLAPSYVLTLDMVFTPNGTDINVSDWFYGLETWLFGGLPFFLLLIEGIGSLVPMWVVQKIILFLTLFLAGFSAHSLCPAKNQWGKYFAGLIYMLNPFVYVRFMAGHWLILLGYAMAPFAIKAMLNFFEQPNLRKTLIMTLLLTLVGVFSAHILLLVLLVFLIFFAAKLIQSRSNLAALMKLMRGVGLAAGAFMLLNVYWILPALTAKATMLSQIGREDLYAFTARSWGAGPNVLFSLASMHGFWRGGYHYISDILPGWYLIYVFILFLAIYGFVARYSDKEIGHYVKAFGVVAVISLVLAAGISTPYFSSFFEFLFDHIFFFRGFRDSQRFVALLALAYSYLGGLGVGEFSQQLRLGKMVSKRTIGNIVLCALALISLFVYNINMLGGFNGQLATKEYPSEWYEVNHYLNQQDGDFNVLFFPWHWYMTFTWSGDRLVNPAGSFFDRKLIQGENIEIGPIETQSPKPVQHYVHFLLEHRNEIKNLGEFIAPLNVKYVILGKEVDFKQYDFLYKQKDLKVVLENPKIVLFKNLHPIAKLYHTNSVCQLKDWEELLLLFDAEDRDIMDYAFLLGDESNIDQPPAFLALNYTSISPIKYEVQSPGKGVVVFSAPYDDGWVLNGMGLLPNLGITNAFPITKSGSYTIHYKRFHTLLIYYLISMTCLLAIIATLAFTQGKTKA